MLIAMMTSDKMNGLASAQAASTLSHATTRAAIRFASGYVASETVSALATAIARDVIRSIIHTTAVSKYTGSSPTPRLLSISSSPRASRARRRPMPRAESHFRP